MKRIIAYLSAIIGVVFVFYISGEYIVWLCASIYFLGMAYVGYLKGSIPLRFTWVDEATLPVLFVLIEMSLVFSGICSFIVYLNAMINYKKW